MFSTDIDKNKSIKLKIRLPFFDNEMKNFKSKRLNLTVTTFKQTIKKSNFTIVAVPTDYDNKSNKFNTHIVENVIEKIVKESLKQL